MNPVPVTIRGVTYPSIGAAARALGVGRTAVQHAIRLGRLDRVGLGPARGRPRGPDGRFLGKAALERAA